MLLKKVGRLISKTSKPVLHTIGGSVHIVYKHAKPCLSTLTIGKALRSPTRSAHC